MHSFQEPALVCRIIQTSPSMFRAKPEHITRKSCDQAVADNPLGLLQIYRCIKIHIMLDLVRKPISIRQQGLQVVDCEGAAAAAEKLHHEIPILAHCGGRVASKDAHTLVVNLSSKGLPKTINLS